LLSIIIGGCNVSVERGVNNMATRDMTGTWLCI